MLAFSLAAAFMAVRGVPAWLRWSHTLRDEAETVRLQHLAQDALVDQVPELTRILAAGEQRLLEVGPWTMSADAPDAAAAEFGNMISTMALSAGLAIESLQVSADTTTWQSFTEISARLRLAGAYRNVFELLVRLETGPPAIRIRDATFRRQRSAEGNVIIHADVLLTSLSLAR